ncbi:hypothetical protein BDZ89DRAFT_1157943 [Hymenopellis radicata]|nr:hypothetical protein BDZ89DRAFT_1157943 [Hymenopellis radicata]
MLRLGKKSMKAPLYTETGMTPIRVRRYMLTLGFLKYAIGLGDGHLTRAALDSARSLYEQGKPGWGKDLEVAAEKLPFDVPVLDIARCTVADVDGQLKAVERAMDTWLIAETAKIEKLYLIHNRVDSSSPKKKPAVHARMLRTYLKVPIAEHRCKCTVLGENRDYETEMRGRKIDILVV